MYEGVGGKGQETLNIMDGLQLLIKATVIMINYTAFQAITPPDVFIAPSMQTATPAVSALPTASAIAAAAVTAKLNALEAQAPIIKEPERPPPAVVVPQGLGSAAIPPPGLATTVVSYKEMIIIIFIGSSWNDSQHTLTTINKVAYMYSIHSSLPSLCMRMDQILDGVAHFMMDRSGRKQLQ